MQVQLELKGMTLIAKFKGELDHHSAKDVKELLEEAIQTKAVKNLVFDFTNLSFMDSSGIGVIIGRYKLIAALGGRVNVVCSSPHIERLMTMSGLKKLVSVYSNLGMALSNI